MRDFARTLRVSALIGIILLGMGPLGCAPVPSVPSLEKGQGVSKDKAEAVPWYRWAAEQGYALAQYNLGYMYANGQGIPKDEAEAVRWYRKAVEQDDARATEHIRELLKRSNTK
jgi:hypothetical protein